MKRVVILCFVLLMTLGMSAQSQQKKWSVIPKIGVNFSNLSDMSVWADCDEAPTPSLHEARPRTMTDLLVGAEFDYNVHPALEIGVGAYYSRQGCHYKNFSNEYPTNPDDPTVINIEGWENNNVHLQYLNIPVIAKLHVNDNVALKAGVQCGVYLSGNWVYDITTITKNNITDKYVGDPVFKHHNDDLDYWIAPTCWSVPLGVEFEYERVVLDVNYALPLSGFCKKKVDENFPNGFTLSKGRNRVLSMTVGYRF